MNVITKLPVHEESQKPDHQNHRPVDSNESENNNEQNNLEHEESYLKDIIYLTLLRQKIDGSVFDADFCSQDQPTNQPQDRTDQSEKSSINSTNDCKSQHSISELLQRRLHCLRATPPSTEPIATTTTTSAAARKPNPSKAKIKPKAGNSSQVATIRVHIPELKAEIEIDCQPHDNFWHLKLCLVDNLLNSGQSLVPGANGTDGEPATAFCSIKGRRSNSIVSHLLLSSRNSTNPTSIKRRSSLASRAKNVISRRRPHCYSSGCSLSSTDASTCSATNTSSSGFGITQSQTAFSDSLKRCESTTGQALYYGFSAFNLSHWDDNARHSSDLTEDEAAAVSALELATATSQVISDSEDQDYEHGAQVEFDENVEDDISGGCRNEGDYATLTISDHSSSPDGHLNDNLNSIAQQQQNDSTGNRLFEQALKSGYLNYGFYSFSLAKYIDDQTHLTDYLSLVSSSSGASYYLDLEFKLKQRQQTPSASVYYLAPVLSSNSSTLNVISRPLQAQQPTSHRLSLAANSKITTITTSTINKSALSFVQQSNIEQQQQLHLLQTLRPPTAPLSCQTTNQSLANNMIARLSTGGGAPTHPVGQHQPNSSQSKRKRSKLIDMLLNTNWSKSSQQAGNLMKLNKILLVCDANFLDEKTGESPLSLAISSAQIIATQQSQQSATSSSIATSCPQSASLFSLQCQSNGFSQMMLQQTNISELIHSKAPLIERLLLLLIKSGALIDFRNSDGRTPLHVATMKSNFWALKTLLDLGASTDYRDINGLTPLYYSILHKADLKVTQLLLNHNKNPSSSGPTATENMIDSNLATRLQTIGITDQHGWQEVHQACKLGLEAHLEKLLYYGCDMNAKISGSGNTPLHVAAINDQLNCAKVLLMRGADKTITNNSHQTAHQVAVISNNMDLAEFIAEHNDAKVIPFTDRPANYFDVSAGRSTRSSTRSSMANSHSSVNLAGQHHQHQRAIVVPQQPVQQFHHSQQQSTKHEQNMMNPLVLDVAQGTQHPPATNSGNSSGAGSQPQSLLSISGPNQLNVHVNNISPCLSQRSCATSNTTSSSGVCCDGDGGSNSTEEINQQHHQQQARLNNSQSQHSNITIISIGKTNANVDAPNNCSSENGNDGSRYPIMDYHNHHQQHLDQIDQLDENEEDDLRSSGSNSSSSNGLYSIMSEERPLFVGTIVQATSEYQSGDPNHLQLHRGDLIEVLEFKPELLQSGQMPRLANKPMLHGRRQSDNQSGLFPSFCVQRSKHKLSNAVQKLPLNNVTNVSKVDTSQVVTNFQHQDKSIQESIKRHDYVKGNETSRNLSLASLNQQQQAVTNSQSNNVVAEENQFKSKFREMEVILNKTNEGFGFVLRGAKVDPATLSSGNVQLNNKVIIDERLMAANNLISLQYLDEIEMNSVAHQAGLKRGDFLVAVNNKDVRLSSHEQVVHMIRQSGDQVHLKIATPIGQRSHMNYGANSKTLVAKVKPEPPKRDPNTTLTRNRTRRGKSLVIHSQQQLNHQSEMTSFDANKPLPLAPSNELPMSPTGSLNLMARSYSSNLTHFQSTQSLSSNTAFADTQSISSISTISGDHHQQQQSSQQPTPTHSSSSTTTVNTVATMKPKAPPKPTQAQLNNATNSLNYQSAVITTTKRNSQQQQQNISPTSPPKVRAPSTTITSQAPQAAYEKASQAPPLPPPPPPPPPPLPNFSDSPKGDRLSQRRTSAPTNQSTGLLLDGNRLQKKRESLAVVCQTQASFSNTAPVPAQFGAVAAACAAAANSRLQRQQQQQQDQLDLQSRPFKEIVDDTDPPTDTATPKASQSKEIEQSAQVNFVPPIFREQDNQDELGTLASQARDISIEASVVPLQSSNRLVNKPPNMQMSATLDRNSSAQIIQQPKQQAAQIHQRYSSQTLRAKPKRTEIPNYDELPPPSPPLPLTLEDSIWRSAESRATASSTKQAVYQNHAHSAQQHNHHKHQVEYQPETSASVPSKRQSQDFIQQQQLFLLHQQQMIKQQLRQQQMIQQQQQQLKLQQQIQFQQGICLDAKHGLGYVHGHGHDHHDHNHHHHHHHSHHNNKGYETNVNRGQHHHQHTRSHQPQQQLVTVQQQTQHQHQQQQLQLQLQHQQRLLAAKSHAHHHHHHHHHPQL